MEWFKNTFLGIVAYFQTLRRSCAVGVQFDKLLLTCQCMQL